MVGTWKKLTNKLRRSKTTAGTPERAENTRPQTAFSPKQRDSVSSLSSSEITDTSFIRGEYVSASAVRVRRPEITTQAEKHKSSQALQPGVLGRANTMKPLPSLPLSLQIGERPPPSPVNPIPPFKEVLAQNRWTQRHFDQNGHPWQWAAETRRELETSATVSSGPGLKRSGAVRRRQTEPKQRAPKGEFDPNNRF